jgi:hypothetical protein
MWYLIVLKSMSLHEPHGGIYTTKVMNEILCHVWVLHDLCVFVGYPFVFSSDSFVNVGNRLWHILCYGDFSFFIYIFHFGLFKKKLSMK